MLPHQNPRVPGDSGYPAPERTWGRGRLCDRRDTNMHLTRRKTLYRLCAGLFMLALPIALLAAIGLCALIADVATVITHG